MIAFPSPEWVHCRTHWSFPSIPASHCNPPLPEGHVRLGADRGDDGGPAAAKAKRHGLAVAVRLAALKTAAEGTEPMMPVIIDAVRARATLGEISDTLRAVWGVYRG